MPALKGVPRFPFVEAYLNQGTDEEDKSAAKHVGK